MVLGSSKFRSRGRIPVLSYFYKENNVSYVYSGLSMGFKSCLSSQVVYSARNVVMWDKIEHLKSVAPLPPPPRIWEVLGNTLAQVPGKPLPGKGWDQKQSLHELKVFLFMQGRWAVFYNSSLLFLAADLYNTHPCRLYRVPQRSWADFQEGLGGCNGRGGAGKICSIGGISSAEVDNPTQIRQSLPRWTSENAVSRYHSWAI